MAKQSLLKKNMRLFGLPYQFNESVDPRAEEFSTEVGRKFAENIILDAPVISIIPGNPKYLGSGKADKKTMTQSLISAASDNLNPLKSILKDTKEDHLRYYDFERAYTEYMKYVNILCRTCAAFLEINEEIDGFSCQQYDYRKYRWTTDNIHGNTTTERAARGTATALRNKLNNITQPVRNIFNGGASVSVSLSDTSIDSNPKSPQLKYITTADEDDGDDISDILTNYNFVQFFIDSDISFSESMDNRTGDSMIKSALEQGSNMFKELSFIMGSAGLENASQGLEDMTSSLLQGLGDTFNSISTDLTKTFGRVLNLGSNVVKGENMIMPQVYQNSGYEKTYQFTVHLKTPYGTKFGYFLDICVPLMHLLALGLPKQTTANTYGSPFIIKAYCEGIFTCNMGIVQSMTVQKGVNSAFSVDGLPTEVDVTVSLVDLYSDLSMSPQSDPILFANNSSLVEFLATTCGLSLITPNIEKRVDMMVNSVKNAIADVPNTIVSSITEAADSILMDFLGLNKW